MDLLFVSLGLFIIDENEYAPSSGRPGEKDIIGGGGSYAIQGSRMVAGIHKAKHVAGIIDAGSDFPSEVEQEFESWHTGHVVVKNNNRLTTRGVNIYDEHDVRHFKYLTPKKRVEIEDIITHNLIQAQSFHFCCSIERAESIIQTVHSHNSHNAVFIFEPAPDVCCQENYPNLANVLPIVTCFSPNLNEACAFLGIDKLPETESQIAGIASKFMPYLTLSGSGIVLRCGSLGCYVKTDDVGVMLPAYHTDQAKVVDVTGGGNSFCGAFITALVLSDGDWVLAGVLGNVISGCVIEKLGVAAAGNGDTWNGLTIRQRCDLYLDQNPSIDVNREKLDWLK